MSLSSLTIARNTSVLMASQLITWGFSFLLSIIQPRFLGPTGIGQLQLAASLWAIVAVVAALGTDLLITKEVARSPERLNELVGTTLALRTMSFIVGVLGMGVYILFAGYSPQTMLIIWILGVSSLIGQLSATFDSAFKGLEKMQYSALAAIVSIAILSFLSISLLLLGFGVTIIALVGIASSSASLGVLFYYLKKRYGVRLYVNWGFMVPLLKASLPFFLVYAGIVLYHQVDTVIISLLVDEASVGWYGAANRLIGSLLFIPNVFVTALFPALSRTHKDNPYATQALAQKSLHLLVLVSIPIGWGMSVIASQLVVLLFGAAFANSGPVLAVRGGFLFLTYINMLLGFLLISLDRQKAWAGVILIATFATIPLDLVLVPWTVKTFANGALGGALSFIFTEVGQTIAGLSLLPKGYFSWSSGKSVMKLIIAGLVMVGAIWFLRDVFLFIPIFVGAATYAGMVFILRALTKEDWNFVVNTIGSVFQRVRGRLFRMAEAKGS